MERLTEHMDYCFLACYEQQGDKIREECPIYYNCYSRQMHEKLSHYEDLEEQGRLIELPCKVGDTVWNVNEYAEGFKIRPMEVESMTIKEGNKSIVYLAYLDKPDGLVHGYGFDDFGYVLFLTKEEAEAKLKELKEGAE